ncbi:MAG: hypothetical protein FJW40_26300 [Acidobacteria bacterium]|nr:hypothetical protein [Acidobacteriota bacterium]
MEIPVYAAVLKPPCPLASVPEWLAVNIAETAIRAGRMPVAARLLQQFGPRLLHQRPIIAALWAVEQGNKPAALAALARAAAGLDNSEDATLAAGLYQRLGELELALEIGVRHRLRQPIADIHYAAAEAGNGKLRLAAADALMRLFESNESRLLRATTLADLGSASEALGDLRHLVRAGSRDPQVLQLYGGTLLDFIESSRSTDPADGDELETYARTRLAPGVAGGDERARIAVLLRRFKRWTLALPELERLAGTGDDWLWNYVEAGREAGIRPALASFLRAEAARTEVPRKARDLRIDLLSEEDAAAAVPYLSERALRPELAAEERRQLAWRLLHAGEKASALAVFELLAANAAPDSPDTSQLIHLWGPKAGERELAWLERRARAAKGAARAGWIDHLIGAGAPARAARIESGGHPAVRDALLRAHQAARDTRSFERLIREAVAASGSPAELRKYAALALEESLTEAAFAANVKLLSVAPNDGHANREVGKTAFAKGRYRDAGQHLGAVAERDHDSESLFLLGELARRNGEAAKAQDHWGAALARKGSNAVLEAQILARLGRWSDASTAFEKLLASRQEPETVQAEYTSALIERGDLNRARQILEAAPKSPRMVQLRSQWAAAMGRTREAATILEPLLAASPADPHVVAQAASIAYQAGHRRHAEALYQQAAGAAPEREDWMETLTALDRERAPVSGFDWLIKRVGANWREQSKRIEGQAALAPAWRLRASGEFNQVYVRDVRRADGRTGSLDSALFRGEMALSWEGLSGQTVSTSLFHASQPGAGVKAGWSAARGRTILAADYGRPFWEFTEGLAGGGKRDRVSIERQQSVGRRGSAWVTAHSNRYGLQALANAGRTAGATGGASLALRTGRPTLIAQYGFDIEHVRQLQQRRDAAGNVYAPVPLLSREVHAFTGGSSGQFGRKGTWDISAGWAVDRLGGRGPYVSGSVLWTPAANLKAGVWFDRRLNMIATGVDAAVLVRAGIWWTH